MTESLENSLQTLKMNSRIYKQALEGLDREQLVRRPGSQSNPMIWVAGHLLLSRCRLANYVGLQQEACWPELFKRTSAIQDEGAYPEIDEILSRWEDVKESLKERVSNLSEEELSGPGPFPMPVETRDLDQGIAFLLWHETYHIGQMGYLRKWLGFEGLVG